MLLAVFDSLPPEEQSVVLTDLLRRVGEFCIWLPAYDLMLAGDWESQEYAPPEYVDFPGVPMIHRSKYTRLATDVRQFPAFDELPPMLAPDAARTVQWDAPLNVLGALPARPTLKRDTVLAVSDSDAVSASISLQETLDRFMGAAGISVEPADGGQPVEFHLDGPHYPAWTPLRQHDGFTSLQLADRLAVRLAR